jgi:hypothetical protein
VDFIKKPVDANCRFFAPPRPFFFFLINYLERDIDRETNHTPKNEILEDHRNSWKNTPNLWAVLSKIKDLASYPPQSIRFCVACASLHRKYLSASPLHVMQFPRPTFIRRGRGGRRQGAASGRNLNMCALRHKVEVLAGESEGHYTCSFIPFFQYDGVACSPKRRRCSNDTTCRLLTRRWLIVQSPTITPPASSVS